MAVYLRIGKEIYRLQLNNSFNFGRKVRNINYNTESFRDCDHLDKDVAIVINFASINILQLGKRLYL